MRAIDYLSWAMIQREKICARIRALLAKTVENGCTEDEAIAAAQKAAEMLARYNLTIDEVEMRESPFARYTDHPDDLVGERLWKPAVAISELTGARYWTQPPGAPPEITFFGFEHEVLVAKYLLEICGNAMRWHEQRQRRTMRLLHHSVQRRRVIPFIDGMADRLHARILTLKPPQPAGTGLMVLHRELIDQALKDEGIGLKTRNMRGSRDFDDGYKRGLRAADGVALHKGVSGASNTGLRLT